jgi:bloom syndrome protein
MIDQVQHLERRGVDAVLLNSDQGIDRSRLAMGRLTGHGRKPSLLYVTPEKLDKSTFLRDVVRRLYGSGELARFVIDEAHCISTWGRDFRDSVRQMSVVPAHLY